MGDYVVFHDVAWHGVYALYFFLIGISAALYFFSALSFYREEFKPLRATSFYGAFALLAVAGLILVGDLSQPLRFVNTLNPGYWNMSSPLVWGTILIVLYGLVSVWYFLKLGDEKAAKLPAVIGAVIALGLPIYTGFDLAVHQARPVWNTPLMPVLFVALSLVSGAAVASFLAKGEARLLGALRQIMLWTTGATAVMVLSLLITTAYGGSSDELTYMFMTSGTIGGIFVGLGILGGTAVPLVLLLLPFGKERAGLLLSSVLILVGGLSLRYSILMGPQIVQTFFS
ncbi:MAG: polysulfide reductase NrfD [Betaproteobacteria bacterium]|nr:polysulfide reductase NrfD [Betaproteobacteria bacterium]